MLGGMCPTEQSCGAADWFPQRSAGKPVAAL